ncbi:MAG: nucleotide exchange factor GrpE [Peptostreptococcus anaerobius]
MKGPDTSSKKSGLKDRCSLVDFDPNLHMAVMQEESTDHEAGKILMELQPGYKLGKKVIRASMVKVSC